MTPRSLLSVLIPAGLSLAAITSAPALFARSEAAVSIPAPRLDVPARAGLQTAVLAGGCFWGMEGVFEHVKGVTAVTSGYAGGNANEATYETVSTERTRHAEAVRVVYDPRVVSYGTLLRVYFSVAHNPTELNRQGPDTGTSYRSALFPIGAEQAKVAKAYIAQLAATRVYSAPIVTRIESGRFYPAEAYHQDFLNRNPNHPYIRANDLPKVASLKATFPALYQVKSAS